MSLFVRWTPGSALTFETAWRPLEERWYSDGCNVRGGGVNEISQSLLLMSAEDTVSHA